MGRVWTSLSSIYSAVISVHSALYATIVVVSVLLNSTSRLTHQAAVLCMPSLDASSEWRNSVSRPLRPQFVIFRFHHKSYRIIRTLRKQSLKHPHVTIKTVMNLYSCNFFYSFLQLHSLACVISIISYHFCFGENLYKIFQI